MGKDGRLEGDKIVVAAIALRRRRDVIGWFAQGDAITVTV